MGQLLDLEQVAGRPLVVRVGPGAVRVKPERGLEVVDVLGEDAVVDHAPGATPRPARARASSGRSARRPGRAAPSRSHQQPFRPGELAAEAVQQPGEERHRGAVEGRSCSGAGPRRRPAMPIGAGGRGRAEAPPGRRHRRRGSAPRRGRLAGEGAPGQAPPPTGDELPAAPGRGRRRGRRGCGPASSRMRASAGVQQFLGQALDSIRSVAPAPSIASARERSTPAAGTSQSTSA